MRVTPEAEPRLGLGARHDRGREAPRAPAGRPAFLDTDPWRALRILSEFVEGFDALAAVGPAVTVFGSARTKRRDPMYKLARSIGRHWPRPVTR